MNKYNDQNRTNELISEIRDIVDNRAAQRDSIVQITARFAELIAIFNRQSSRVQNWMIFLTIAITIMTLVLIVLTIVIIIKM
jgi:hypothetical protein